MRTALVALLLTVGAAVPALAQAPAAPPSPTGHPLTLQEAVAIALERQPNILAVLNDYAAARFVVDQALAPLLPQFTGSISTTRSSQAVLPQSLTATAPITIQRDFNQTLLGQVSVSQLLFDFGQNKAATDVARKNAAVSLENVELQRQLITFTVKQAFTQLNFAKRLFQVNQQALERAELNLRSARGFFEVGTQPKSAVTRAEVDVANAGVAIIQARNAERVARVALNTAMGLTADTPTEVTDNLVYTPVQFDPVQLQADALRQRPEYLQTKLRAEAAEAFERQASRNFFPTITGSATYGGFQTDLLPGWSANLNLTWPFFDGGGRLAVYRQAKASLEAARARVRASELDISRDVEQSRLNVTEANERIQASLKAVESAQENFRLAQGRFDAGVGTILELTDAQLALIQSQNTEAQALQDFQIALAQLDRAVGRR
jgi:outer membrane protein